MMPRHWLFGLGSAYYVDSTFRPGVSRTLLQKSKMGGAACYAYLFAYESPIDNGTSAWHCAEIPFAFHNVE